MDSEDIGGSRWIEDVGVGSWIQLGDAERGYPRVVRDLVPDHFEAYARLLHAFWLNQGRVRWGVIASANGRAVTPTMPAEDAIATSLPQARGAGLTVGPSMSPEDWETVGPILQRHTESDTVVFGAWEGRGRPASAPADGLMSLPNRRYFLAEVPFTEWATSEVLKEIVNIAWPLDRSWFLNSDIDACASYLGGTSELVTELLASSQLEVMPAELDDPVWSY
jgi:hypothetical protein